MSLFHNVNCYGKAVQVPMQEQGGTEIICITFNVKNILKWFKMHIFNTHMNCWNRLNS